MKCWSDIGAWRNSSASFVNAHIPGRTWSVTSFYSSTVTDWTKTTTLYPSSVSTYKLCDESPRANVRPTTTVLHGNTTLWGTWTKTLTPTIAPQPCTLGAVDCRLLRMDTDAEIKDEDELLRQCGNPAHVEGGAQCLLGGGPVELVYFPVEKTNGSLCTNKSSGITPRPLQPGLSHITTLGHTFMTDSVYLSFKTLYATYDGFWDHVGPTFSDLIVPLHSSDVSTQCGGWNAAYGSGTPLNYADLNWPVPATAYKCQHRCSDSLTSSASLASPNNLIIFNIETVPPGPECDTIWSDVNPVLAVPTKIRQMVPEWSTCSFWNANLANFWFDPPIALQPAEAAATPTLPSMPETTVAAPLSTPTSPAAPNTQDPTPASTSRVPGTPSSSQVTSSSHTSSSIASSTNAPVQTYDPSDPAESVQDPTSTNEEASFIVSTASEVSQNNPQASSTVHFAPAPAISVLTEALATMDPTSTAYTFDPVSSTHELPAFTFGPTSPANGIASSGAVFSVGGEEETAARTSDHYVLESTTLKAGEAATISGHVISAAPSSLIVDSVAVPLSALPNTSEDPKPSLIAIGGLTLTASPLSDESQAAAIGTHTLSAGGPAVTISGETITHASQGLAVISGSQAVVLTAIDQSLETSDPPAATSKPSEQIGYAAGSVTVKASALSGSGYAIVIDGTIVSQDGPAITASGHILTIGSSGLVLADPHSTVPFSALRNPTSSEDDDKRTWAFGSVTVAAAPVKSQTNVVSLAGTTLSQGGEAVEVGGATLTMGSNGLEVINPGTTEAMSRVSEMLPVIVGMSSPLPTNSSLSATYSSTDIRLSTTTMADTESTGVEASRPTSSESGGSKTTTDVWRLAVAIAMAILWISR